MVTPAMGAAMMGPMYSLWLNGAQHDFRGFHFRLSILQGSTTEEPIVAYRYRNTKYWDMRCMVIDHDITGIKLSIFE